MELILRKHSVCPCSGARGEDWLPAGEARAGGEDNDPAGHAREIRRRGTGQDQAEPVSPMTLNLFLVKKRIADGKTNIYQVSVQYFVSWNRKNMFRHFCYNLFSSYRLCKAVNQGC